MRRRRLGGKGNSMLVIEMFLSYSAKMVPVKAQIYPACSVDLSVTMFDACVADRGELFVWGKNVRGCLGIGKRDDQFFPWRVRQH